MGLDDIDKQILNLLQENARMKLTAIGKKVGKPPSTIFDRINKMEQEGVIKGYEARLDAEKLGVGVTAFVLGQAKLGKDVNFDATGRTIGKIPEVQEVHFITGDYDYLIKIRVKDQNEYFRVIQRIAACLGVRGQGMISPKTFKETSNIYLR